MGGRPYTIVFSSNRDAVPDDWSDSLWTVDTGSGEASKLAGAVPDGAAYVVLHADGQSVVARGSDYVYQHIIGSGHTAQYELSGVPFSVSEDGRYVLYNELDETDTALPDISILDLLSGRISRVPHQKKQTIHNGAWNEGNTSFAFYSKSFDESRARLFVLNLTDNTVRRIKLPDKLGHIDPHGAIS
jgi:hypothetical protein